MQSSESEGDLNLSATLLLYAHAEKQGFFAGMVLPFI